VPLPPKEFQAALEELHRLTEAEGRDPQTLTISYKAPIYDVGSPLSGVELGTRRPFSGKAAQIVDDVATYARMGVSELIFDFRSETVAETLDRMEDFATTVKASTD